MGNLLSSNTTLDLRISYLLYASMVVNISLCVGRFSIFYCLFFFVSNWCQLGISLDLSLVIILLYFSFPCIAFFSSGSQCNDCRLQPKFLSKFEDELIVLCDLFSESSCYIIKKLYLVQPSV